MPRVDCHSPTLWVKGTVMAMFIAIQRISRTHQLMPCNSSAERNKRLDSAAAAQHRAKVASWMLLMPLIAWHSGPRITRISSVIPHIVTNLRRTFAISCFMDVISYNLIFCLRSATYRRDTRSFSPLVMVISNRPERDGFMLAIFLMLISIDFDALKNSVPSHNCSAS